MTRRDIESRAEGIIELAIPDNPHPGFSERHGLLAAALRNQILGSLAASGEVSGISLQTRMEGMAELHKSELTAFNAVRSLDTYLHNQDWHYKGERHEEHQELVLHDILSGLVTGHTEGFAELATSTGKTYVIAKLGEAFYQGGLRVLILAPTTPIARQNIGTKDGKGLARFAPKIASTDVGRHFDKHRATSDHRIVVSTYQSLNNFARTGELGEFDIILADEAHRSLGLKTAESMKSFSPHAVKIGLTATPRFGLDKSVDELLPYCYHRLGTREAIEAGLTAPVQCLPYITNTEIPDLDPAYAEFTPRELARLANVKSRNQQAAKLARSFVADGRSGIISCLPGENLAHARLLADELSALTVLDRNTGEERQIVARAVGNFNKDEVSGVLEDFESGAIDILTYVNIIGEGWDSQVASFLINTCPTTSFVKITQQVGRILRKKSDGMHSIVVDFIDKAVGKEQKTALHVLGQEVVDFNKIYGRPSDRSSGTRVSTYLRGLLDPDLYARLKASDGSLLQSLVIKPRERSQRSRLAEYYERLLAKEGLSGGTHEMAVPDKLLKGIAEYEDICLNERGRLPTEEELLTRLEYLRLLPARNSRKTLRRALAARDIVLSGLMLDVVEDSVRVDSLDPPEAAIEPFLVADVRFALSFLSERERTIVELRNGLNDNDTHTLADIADILGLSRERVRKIEAKTFEKLRAMDSPYLPLREWI